MPAPKPARSILKTLTERLITGNVARLTIYDDGRCVLERQDYVSPGADGWRQVCPPQEGAAKDYQWVENQLVNSPADWSE